MAKAYRLETDRRRRAVLVHCLWQFRDAAALPALASALSNPDDGVWKEALDGIVTLGGEAAVQVLAAARGELSRGPDQTIRSEWIDEAIQKVRRSGGPG